MVAVGKSGTNQPSDPQPLRWIDLPLDLTANILQRLGPVKILETAQYVCATWRTVCQDPDTWRFIDMPYYSVSSRIQRTCRRAVDLSRGGLIGISVVYFADDDFLLYVSERSSHLKRLRIEYCGNVTGYGLTLAVSKLPELEELYLGSIRHRILADHIRTIGICCPLLKSFTLDRALVYRVPCHDKRAMAIARNMPNLRHLGLQGNKLSAEGLKAILVGCPRLESIDLEGCDLPHLDEGFCFESIKDLRRRLFKHSTANYYDQWDDEEGYQDDWSSSEFAYSDEEHFNMEEDDDDCYNIEGDCWDACNGGLSEHSTANYFDPQSTTTPLELVGTSKDKNKVEKTREGVFAEADAGVSPSLRGFNACQADCGFEQVDVLVPREKPVGQLSPYHQSYNLPQRVSSSGSHHSQFSASPQREAPYSQHPQGPPQIYGMQQPRPNQHPVEAPYQGPAQTYGPPPQQQQYPPYATSCCPLHQQTHPYGSAPAASGGYAGQTYPFFNPPSAAAFFGFGQPVAGYYGQKACPFAGPTVGGYGLYLVAPQPAYAYYNGYQAPAAAYYGHQAPAANGAPRQQGPPATAAAWAAQPTQAGWFIQSGGYGCSTCGGWVSR